MAVTEESRHRLYQRLEVVLGEEQASTLMEHLPAGGSSELATRRDIGLLRRDAEQQGTDLRREIEQQGTDLRREIGEVRTELRHEIAQLRSEMHQGFDQLRAEWRRDLLQQTFALLAANGAVVGLGLAAVRFA